MAKKSMAKKTGAKKTLAKKAKKAPNWPRQPRQGPLLAHAQAISELAAAISRYADAKEAIDAAYYLYPFGAPLDTKGASVTYARDELAKSTSMAVQGFASYVLWRPDLPNPPIDGDPSLPKVRSSLGLSGYAAAPSVYANGTLGEPFKASERSAQQAGIDNQFELAGGGLFPLQTLRFTPYGQTDFRGKAGIGGFSGTYEPYLPIAHWGVNPNFGPQWIGFYFRMVAEANVFRVANAGLTNYASNTTYSFLGGTAELNATLFQNMPEFGSYPPQRAIPLLLERGEQYRHQELPRSD